MTTATSTKWIEDLYQDTEIQFLEKATDGRTVLKDIDFALDEYKRLYKAGIASPAEMLTLSRAYPDDPTFSRALRKMGVRDDDSLVVGGPASIELVDREGHLITTDALGKAFQKYMSNFRTRNAMVLHSDVQVGWALPAYISKGGQIFKSGVDDKGLFFITELRNDTKIAKKVREQIDEGKLKSYSIAGRATKTQTIQKGLMEVMQVDELELAEVTVCEKGVNQGASFDILKAENSATSSCVDGSCLIKSDENCDCGCNSQEVELMYKSDGDIDFIKSFLKKQGMENQPPQPPDFNDDAGEQSGFTEPFPGEGTARYLQEGEEPREGVQVHVTDQGARWVSHVDEDLAIHSKYDAELAEHKEKNPGISPTGKVWRDMTNAERQQKEQVDRENEEMYGGIENVPETLFSGYGKEEKEYLYDWNHLQETLGRYDMKPKAGEPLPTWEDVFDEEVMRLLENPFQKKKDLMFFHTSQRRKKDTGMQSPLYQKFKQKYFDAKNNKEFVAELQEKWRTAPNEERYGGNWKKQPHRKLPTGKPKRATKKDPYDGFDEYADSGNPPRGSRVTPKPSTTPKPSRAAERKQETLDALSAGLKAKPKDETFQERIQRLLDEAKGETKKSIGANMSLTDKITQNVLQKIVGDTEAEGYGESFPTLMNTQGRQDEHHRLLDQYGFPSELEAEYARYTPVIEEDPSPLAHRLPPWVVNEAGQNLGERHYDDALTTPQLGRHTKRGIEEGANSSETPVDQLNDTEAFDKILAAESKKEAKAKKEITSTAEIEITITKSDEFFNFLEKENVHIYKESCPCESCFHKSSDYTGNKQRANNYFLA